MTTRKATVRAEFPCQTCSNVASPVVISIDWAKWDAMTPEDRRKSGLPGKIIDAPKGWHIQGGVVICPECHERRARAELN